MLNLDKLNKISTPDTTWSKSAIYRQENSDWLRKSAQIALVVLRALKDKSMSQKNLAVLLNVKPQQINKIVKGKENLTLETICKLERALDIKIIDINMPYIKEFEINNIPVKDHPYPDKSYDVYYKFKVKMKP
jgi:transcriptional regulator with XRE-family HTH domain